MSARIVDPVRCIALAVLNQAIRDLARAVARLNGAPAPKRDRIPEGDGYVKLYSTNVIAWFLEDADNVEFWCDRAQMPAGRYRKRVAAVWAGAKIEPVKEDED